MSRKEREAELARIREQAAADAEEVRERTRLGYSWTPPLRGQGIGFLLTCDRCGAVVTAQTQHVHDDWHRASRP